MKLSASSESSACLLELRGPARCNAQGLRLRVLNSTVDVHCDCPSLLRQVAGVYPEADSIDGEPGSKPDLSIQVLQRTGSGGRTAYWAYHDDSRELIAGSEKRALAVLDGMIERTAIESVQHLLLFHAAAVATPVGTVLIPGVSGAGKSTLAAALAFSGQECLGDDVVAMDPEVQSVHKFSRSIGLKAGGWRAISSIYPMAAPLARARRWDNKDVIYVQLPAPARCPEAGTRTVRFVLLPVRLPGQPARIIPLSRAECVVSLAGSSLNLPAHGRQGVESLIRLVEGANCFSLLFDDLSSAVSEVMSLVRTPARQPRGIL